MEGIQGASSEVVRAINRRIILNLIRRRQPISRADLARVSGLQRSTISLIVEELVDDGWVVEGPTGRLPRGRRPTFLRLTDSRLIIGVDLRPTQTTVALADANAQFLSRETFATPADPRAAIDTLSRHIRSLAKRAAGKKIEGVGILLPGRYDRVSDRLVFAPNLHWRDVDLRSPLQHETGLEVELENDANACVLAAVWFENMDGCRNMVVVTVSEGIGAGVLVNGQIALGANGMAGEFGHVPLDLAGPQCGCGAQGCWEVFASNQAALRYYAPKSPAGIAFTDLMGLAERGNARAIRAIEKMARYLGRGMRMLLAGLAPERIVIVGDLTKAWGRVGPLIESEVRAQVMPGGVMPRIVPVHEDGMARLLGTVALVLQKHFGAPHEVLT